MFSYTTLSVVNSVYVGWLGTAELAAIERALRERDILVRAHAGYGDDLAIDDGDQHRPGDAGDLERLERAGLDVEPGADAHAQRH